MRKAEGIKKVPLEALSKRFTCVAFGCIDGIIERRHT